MTKFPLISIIIPVYKVEKWLRNCVKSALKQNYKNLEIILVDDGSPDRSPWICDELVRKDTRIKVIHKENGGVSSARNVGIQIAQGKYLCFLDADDTLPKSAIANLYKPFERGEIQCSIGSYTAYRVDKQIFFGGCNQFVTVSCIEGILAVLRSGMNYRSACGKLYETKVIKDCNLFFQDGIKFGEDTLFFLNCIPHFDKIAFVGQSIYNYNLLHEGNASSKFYEKIGFWMKTLFECEKELYPEETEQVIELLQSRAVEYAELVFRHMALHRYDKEKSIVAYKDVHQYYLPYLQNISVAVSAEKHEIFAFCEKGNYTELYDTLVSKYGTKKSNVFKSILKNIRMKIRESEFKFKT